MTWQANLTFMRPIDDNYFVPVRIFAIKLPSCPKLHRHFEVFGQSTFWDEGALNVYVHSYYGSPSNAWANFDDGGSSDIRY